MERATAASPCSFLATAGRRRRLRGGQRCGLDNRLGGVGLLGLCAPSRASTPAAPYGSRARDTKAKAASNPALSSQPQDGGVVYAGGSGAVSIIDSEVSGCSADMVRRLELAPLQRLTAAGRGIERRPRLPYPALSSQPQRGGVVMAGGSGAVSIIGSEVSGCSAGTVRRVELASLPAAPHGSGARDREGPRLPYPALSSQPQIGGTGPGFGAVVYAKESGAVSITGSEVSGCSARIVRRVELAPPCSASRQRGEG